ncbi:MAG: hypothetical protein ACP5IF_02280 [Conexivisphaera sp.]
MASMSAVGLKFRAYADGATARALKALPDAACGWTADRDHNAALTGRGPPAVPVELRPLPLPAEWQGGAMSREAPRLQLRSSSPVGKGRSKNCKRAVLRK